MPRPEELAWAKNNTITCRCWQPIQPGYRFGGYAQAPHSNLPQRGRRLTGILADPNDNKPIDPDAPGLK
jgi:hypothetical protein